MDNQKKIRAQYKKLLQLKQYTAFALLFIMGFNLIIFNFLKGSSIAILFIANPLMLSFLWLWFACKDVCPWCGKAFFYSRVSLNMQFFTRKTCIHCGEPKNHNH